MILGALCPRLCNSTRPQHTLQMFADHYSPRQTIYRKIPLSGTAATTRGAVGYLFQTIFNHRSRDQFLEFRTSSEFRISSEFLVQGSFKHTQFLREHWYKHRGKRESSNC